MHLLKVRTLTQTGITHLTLIDSLTYGVQWEVCFLLPGWIVKHKNPFNPKLLWYLLEYGL